MDGKKPLLNTPAVVDALEWFLKIRDEKIIPKECDYEMANALFKNGQAPYIVNGDWSWGDYKAAKMDFGIAPLPQNQDTKLWPSPLVSTRAYSLNAHIKDDKHRDAAIKFVHFMLAPESQKKFTKAVGIFPSHMGLQKDPELLAQPLFKESEKILALGYPMPIFPEIRAVWDSMRSQLQAVLAGSVTPKEGANLAQQNALSQIETMNAVETPGDGAVLIKMILALIFIFLAYKLIKYFKSSGPGLNQNSSFTNLMMIPAFMIVFAVIIYPFIYNFFISISNFSLRTFQDWQIVGFGHYVKILTTWDFYGLLIKTIIWTVVNVFFHTLIGVLLALAINQTLPAKPFWRAILIIPWAVPQYITALTWRGLFHQEYGPINAMIKNYLHMPPVAWLTQPFTAFSACVITNIWLGFPFMMVVALGGLQSIPNELYEAARLDGANAFQRFKLITWPLLQPVLRPAMALGAIWTFNNFNVIWLVGNGGEPADKTHILVTSIYKSAFSLYQYGAAAAGSLIIFLMLFGAAAWTGKFGIAREKAK
jgi:arabinogalactan oligomer/maltooligosaccharide transport system permease protein